MSFLDRVRTRYVMVNLLRIRMLSSLEYDRHTRIRARGESVFPLYCYYSLSLNIQSFFLSSSIFFSLSREGFRVMSPVST